MRNEKGDTRTQWAYQTLKDMIMENRLSHEKSYLEQELATELGISRTPVREAALRLQEEGFVTIRPRLGIRVRPISLTDMGEIYDILTELEPYAASRLAARGLTEEEGRHLDEAVAAMDAALKSGDRTAWAGADRTFHQTLMELAGNARILRIVSTLWDQVHRARMVTLDHRPDLARSNEDHRRLVALIREGDAQGAANLHRRHRSHARAEMMALLTEQGVEEI